MISSLSRTVLRIATAENTLRAGVRKRMEAMSGPIRRAAFSFADEVRARWVSRRSNRTLRNLRADQPLRVHLGSGADLRSGWINIDLSMNITPAFLPPDPHGQRTDYINHDLRRGLPLPKESCELIYSSHFFEHLDRRDGFRLMRDSYRALRPGGIFRIVLPDFRACFEAYVRGEREYFSAIDLDALFPGRHARPLTTIDYLNYTVYQFGEHRCLYDEEKLHALLKGIGFQTVVRTGFESEVDPKSLLRRRYSLYMSAIK